MRGEREKERQWKKKEKKKMKKVGGETSVEMQIRCRREAQQGPRTACSTCCASPKTMFSFHQNSAKKKTFDKVDHSRAAARLRSEKQV